ncbi:putative nuclease HARBI1 [Eupeodes corollae]|uniref:putative nuclease HARBI1 n=1 Tax=Eupeodes corollae TaxID=290404 RepID=UPI002493C334|nr:putative nuclease HARBI1 [Eupeodes corollae]
MPFQFSSFINDFNNLNRVLPTPRMRKVYKKRFNPMSLRSEEFKKKYRFSKKNINKIIGIIRSDLSSDNRGGHIPIDIQVMAAIRYWGRNEIQDDGADIHGFSQPTLCQICKRVARALATKRPLFIKMPTSFSDQIRTMNKFSQIREFPKVVGAIDCTHIRIPKVGGPSGQYYINRKGYYSLNTQVVCDASLKINDIVCRWRGSTHDSRIFRESRIKQRFDDGEFNGRLLGDGGYPCTNILFTPVLNPRTDPEIRYNIAHIATRNTVERCFGVWKQRFRILLSGMRCSLENAKTTIIALAVLHNLAIDLQDVLPPTDDDVNDDNQADSTENQERSQQEGSNQNLTRRVFIEQYFSTRNQ